MNSYPIKYGNKLEQFSNAKNNIEKAELMFIKEVDKNTTLQQNLEDLTIKMNNTLEIINKNEEEKLRLSDDKENALEKIEDLEKNSNKLKDEKNKLQIKNKNIEQDNLVLNNKISLLTDRLKNLENKQLSIIRSGELITKKKSPIDELKKKKRNLLNKYPFFKKNTNIQYEVNKKWYPAKVVKHQYNKKTSRMEVVIKLANNKNSIIPYNNLLKTAKFYKKA
jgi:hypothetical protein